MLCTISQRALVGGLLVLLSPSLRSQEADVSRANNAATTSSSAANTPAAEDASAAPASDKAIASVGVSPSDGSENSQDRQTADRKTGERQTAAAQSDDAQSAAAPAAYAPSSPLDPTDAQTETLKDVPEGVDPARLKELLSLVSDNTLVSHKREGPAYFALVKEILRQSPEELRSRARENPRFHDFYSKPAAHRGEIVHLVLNLRRILPIEVKHENVAGVTKLYELWGWTDEAKAWMYCCITPELPPGLPTSGDVAERIEVTGYFFKMQAYQPGDAAPNARNLVAPVVIGRVSQAPQAVALPSQGLGQWPLVLIVGFGLIIAMRLVMQARTSRSAPTHRNYRRRSLEPLDPDSLRDSLGTRDKGLQIRNADE